MLPIFNPRLPHALREPKGTCLPLPRTVSGHDSERGGDGAGSPEQPASGF